MCTQKCLSYFHKNEFHVGIRVNLMLGNRSVTVSSIDYDNDGFGYTYKINFFPFAWGIDT